MMNRWALWLEKQHLLGKSIGSLRVQVVAAIEFQSELPSFSRQNYRALLRGQAELLRDSQRITRVLRMGPTLEESVRLARLQKINRAA